MPAFAGMTSADAVIPVPACAGTRLASMRVGGCLRMWLSPAPTDKMLMMEPVVAKFRTHREAEEATLEYYRRLSPAERLEILFQLRASVHKEDDAASEGLARVYRIAQLKRS
jgi:hypothetical protein